MTNSLARCINCYLIIYLHVFSQVSFDCPLCLEQIKHLRLLANTLIRVLAAKFIFQQIVNYAHWFYVANLYALLCHFFKHQLNAKELTNKLFPLKKELSFYRGHISNKYSKVKIRAIEVQTTLKTTFKTTLKTTFKTISNLK